MLSETNTHSFENRGLERYKIDFSTLMSTAWWTTVHGGYDLVKPIDVPENISIARRVAGLHQTLSETTRHCTRGGGSQRSGGFGKKVLLVSEKCTSKPHNPLPLTRLQTVLYFVNFCRARVYHRATPSNSMNWCHLKAVTASALENKFRNESSVLWSWHVVFGSGCFANPSQTTVQLTFGQPSLSKCGRNLINPREAPEKQTWRNSKKNLGKPFF